MAAFTNQAILTYRGGTASSNIVTGEVIDVLTAAKAATATTYTTGDTITYVLSLVNTGTTTLTGLTVSDDLGAYPFGTDTLTPLNYVDGSILYYINGVLQTAPTVTAGPPLTISGISIPAGGNAIIVYRAIANAFAPTTVGGEVVNTATVTGGGLSSPIEASATISAQDAAALTITKSLSPATVTENETLTYSFLISNSGNTAAVATDDISVSDTFEPILTDLTVTLDGIPLAEGTDYTYDEATGVFTTVPGRITVPAATVTQDPITGAYTTTAGTVSLVVSGTV